MRNGSLMEKLTPQELLSQANEIARKRVTRASLVKIIRENEEKEKERGNKEGRRPTGERD